MAEHGRIKNDEIKKKKKSPRGEAEGEETAFSSVSTPRDRSGGEPVFVLAMN